MLLAEAALVNCWTLVLCSCAWIKGMIRCFSFLVAGREEEEECWEASAVWDEIVRESDGWEVCERRRGRTWAYY